MSFVRSGEQMKYSKFEESLYVFMCDGDKIEDYGDLTDREAFCEVMFRVLDQAGVTPSLGMVNKVRDRFDLEPLEEISDEYQLTEEFEELLDKIEKEEESIDT